MQIEIICDFSPIKKGRTIIKSPWARLHDESEDWVQNASEESWVDWFWGNKGILKSKLSQKKFPTEEIWKQILFFG